ncbi:hypothetical protein LMIY3S_03611 [Labrys miyagiensis]
MNGRAEIEAFLREMYAHRFAGNVESIMAGFGAEPRFRVAGDEVLGVLSTEVRGVDALRAMMQQLVDNWDWSEYQIQSVIVDGDRAVVHGSGPMLFTPTGQRYETETLDLIRLEDGKIVEFLQFLDTHLLARVVGLAAA